MQIIIKLLISLTIVCIFPLNAFAEETLTIIAASDLRYALDDLVKVFKKNNDFPQEKNSIVNVIYGSSGKSFSQIVHGAPYDIFFSADIEYPNLLKEKNLTLTEPKLYGIGKIVLWSKTFDPNKNGMQGLLDSKVTKIAIANPTHAPYGKRAIESLKYYKLLNLVKDKLVYGENISQATQFVDSGNADIGFTALSIVLAPVMKNKGKYYIIPSNTYSPLKQAYVLLKRAKVNKTGNKFISFMETNQARKVFENYGFIIPKSEMKNE